MQPLINGFQAYETLWVSIGIASALMFLFSLALLPWLLCKLPADYFTRQREEMIWKDLWKPKNLLRNTLGFPLVLAGAVMLGLPGQGILTILIGLAIMNFPGKFKWERWIVTRKGVLSSINWLRKRSNKPALQVELDS